MIKRLQSVILYNIPRCVTHLIKVSVQLMWQTLQRTVLLGGFSVLSFLLLCSGSSKANIPVKEGQPKAPSTKRLSSVIDLQPFQTVHSINVDLPDSTTTDLTLINLNPEVNQWYILRLRRSGKTVSDEYHLENPYPEHQLLVLDEKSPDKLMITRDGKLLECPSWNLFGNSVLENARKSRHVFAPLCNGNFYLRNPTKGHRTTIETVTDFLRDNVPGGESVVGFVKDAFFKDAYLENTRTTLDSVVTSTVSAPDFPSPASIDPIYSDKLIAPANLGIQVEKVTKGMLTGNWYKVKNNPGIFVSLMQPKAVAPDILKSDPHLAKRLDRIESGALVYLVAFDLDRFDLGFAVGTTHPRVGWSPRTVPKMKVPGLPGPDGIDNISPLVRSGMINPVKAARTVATFTGGFKRTHSAFKYGVLANRNHSSHYGFMENGVVLSTLQPGLATLLVRDSGAVEMKTWSDEDNQKIGRIIQGRQNGAPIIEWDSEFQKPIPGSLVAKWAPGNWSGSANKKLRTLRAGIALQQTDDKRFLIYGYFSTATPSAMARVFQAYNCRYAMHLDMNALEHTYLALYHKKDTHLLVQHLIQGMSVLDKSKKGSYIPRFLGYPDNRDFFYLMKREQP